MWENLSAAATVHEQALQPGAASRWCLQALDTSQAPSYAHQIFSLQVQPSKEETCLNTLAVAQSLSLIH